MTLLESSRELSVAEADNIQYVGVGEELRGTFRNFMD
jgi:hypothetical protein